jgi:uncharacterized protein (DUF488 family)
MADNVQYSLPMTIYTVGYEGVSLEDFLQRLRRAHVRLVVDVRGVPLSRKRGFSKTALSAALGAAGLEYRHMRELGCPKPIRDQYRADGDWERYTTAFMIHLHKQKAAVGELAQVCKDLRTALLCYEADPDECHRTYVARAVASLIGGRVEHIGADSVIRDRGTAVAA